MGKAIASQHEGLVPVPSLPRDGHRPTIPKEVDIRRPNVWVEGNLCELSTWKPVAWVCLSLWEHKVCTGTVRFPVAPSTYIHGLLLQLLFFFSIPALSTSGLGCPAVGAVLSTVGH